MFPLLRYSTPLMLLFTVACTRTPTGPALQQESRLGAGATYSFLLI
jgi:hypothetical protein